MRLDKFTDELNAHQKVKANPAIRVTSLSSKTSFDVLEVSYNNEYAEIEILIP